MTFWKYVYVLIWKMYFYHDCRWCLAFRRDWEGTDSVFFPEENRRLTWKNSQVLLIDDCFRQGQFFMMNGHELHEFDGKWIGTCTALLRTQNDFYYKPHLTNCTSVFSMSKHFEHSHTLTQCRGRFSAAASSDLFQHTNWRRRESNHRPTLHPEPQAFRFSVHKREKPKQFTPPWIKQKFLRKSPTCTCLIFIWLALSSSATQRVGWYGSYWIEASCWERFRQTWRLLWECWWRNTEQVRRSLAVSLWK